MDRVDALDVIAHGQVLQRPLQAQRRGERLGQQDAVNGGVGGDLVEQGSERVLIGLLGAAPNGGQAVTLEQPLDLAQVRRRSRVLACLDDCKTGRRRAAGDEAGGAPLDVGPDLFGDRASEQGLRGQTRAPI
jgi:hypothetical protein